MSGEWLTCTDCLGSGQYYDEVWCSQCGGSGRDRETGADCDQCVLGTKRTTMSCPRCMGYGGYWESNVPTIHRPGFDWRPDNTTADVRSWRWHPRARIFMKMPI